MKNVTAIREHFERGTVDKQTLKFFAENVGTTPLCCHKRIYKDEKEFVTCDWVKTWHSPEQFRSICLACQEQIKKMITQKNSEPGHIAE